MPEECRGMRLDLALSREVPEYSRARIQKWIRGGQVRVNGAELRPRDLVSGGEKVEIHVPDEELSVDIRPQDLALDIVHADRDLIVINKPPGMVVHPAAGNPDHTLQNALLFHFPELSAIPRAGIVHRLDKLTSGLLVVARTLRAHTSLVRQLQQRTMGRTYEAVVEGAMVSGGTVDRPIGRHPADRKKMAVSGTGNGKPARTHYRIVQRYGAHTHVRLNLETGRTHQIRVHMASIMHPLVGDPVYGGRKKIPAGASEALVGLLQTFPRQALHASELVLRHPNGDIESSWEAPLPDDMRKLLQTLDESELANAR